jgi:hypothetical protein
MPGTQLMKLSKAAAPLSSYYFGGLVEACIERINDEKKI